MALWGVAALAAAALWLLVSFNRLVRDRNLVREAWSGMDVQLRRRYDLVPSITEAVKGYRDHERKLLGEIAASRARCADARGVGEKGAAENVLSRGIRSLFAVAEAYPDLKASRNFLDLQKNLAAVEDDIQNARRYYNGTVRDYNTRTESFPAMLVAKLFGFRPADFFELEFAMQREAPVVEVEG